MHEEVFAHYDSMTLGEMSCGITPEIGPSFVSREPAKKQLDLIVHFDHVELDCVNGDKWIPRVWKLPELKAAVTAWQTRMADTSGWDTIWMENHDQPRGVSRFCPAAKNRHDQAGKLLALWLFTLKGTVILFQGQELGMTNPEVFSEEMIKDIETRIFWNRVHAQNQGEDKGGSHKLEMAKKAIATKGRDASRIPFPVCSHSISRVCFSQVLSLFSGMAPRRQLVASPTATRSRGFRRIRTFPSSAPRASAVIRRPFGHSTGT